MKNHSTNSFFIPGKPGNAYRVFYRITTVILLALLLSPFIGKGQATIFTETMGTTPSTTAISVHEAANGYDNDIFTMTQGGAANAADMRNTSASSGYTGASGLSNVFFTSTAGERGFAIEGIDASAYTGLTVQFGYRKENGSAHATVALDYWDGTAYVNVPFTFNEAANAPVAWYLSPVISLPAGAQISTLKIRWVKSGSLSIRVDDVVLKGTASNPALYATPGTLSGFTYLVGNGPSASQSYNLSGTNLTGYPGNIVVTGATHYEVSTDNNNFFGSVNVGFTSATLDPTPVYTRLITGLSAGTYNSETISNAGGGASAINVTCNGYVVGAAITYTWTGTTDNDYQVSSNWSPARTSPALNDILVFDNGGTYTITNVPTQTIAKISVTAGTKITFQAAGTNILSILGDTGDDVIVSGGGSELNVSGTNAFTVSLSTGTTGLISGSMTFSGAAAHKLLSVDASSVTFASGSVFTAGTGFTGNVFGTTNLNSVVFQSGSTYVHVSGSNPFGASAPASVVTFQTGSLYKVTGSATPSLSGRTYANLELDSPTVTITVTGASATSIDNLTVTNGILNFNMTGTAGHSIKGNIYVATGATLNFSPASAGTVNLNGTAAQTISGPGTINSTTAFSTININNAAGVTVSNAVTLYNLTVTAGTLTVASGASLIVGGAVTGNVAVERFISGWTDASHGWHLISSPVASQSVAPDFIDGTPANYDFYKWDEVSNTWLNQKEVANGITGFAPGTGYLVAYSGASTRQFNGALNTTDVLVSNLTISGGANSGWNLIGNPFSSAIQWNDGTVWTVPADIAATAKVWNEPTAAYVDVAPGDYIPSLNGAMVQVVSGSPASLTIPAAARVHNATAWYKNEQGSLKLVVYDRTNNTAQESIIKLNDQSSESYDASYDSRFLAGYAPQFYSISGADYLSTNTLPDLGSNRTIEMGFVKNNASEFSIGISSENMVPGLSAYLTDKKTGAVTELKEGQEYNFTSSEGDDHNRFLVHFSALGIDDPAAVSNYNVYAASGNIYIASLENIDADVTISNIAGQVVISGRTGGNSLASFSASALQNGIYLVTVKSAQGITNHKVMISR